MKIFETKIYLRFISWFVLVSLVPIFGLFFSIYLFEKDSDIFVNKGLQQAVIFGILISTALVFIFSLIATRKLSKAVTHPIQVSVTELSKVVDELFKSVQNLSEISQNSSQLSEFMLSSSQGQEEGIKKGNKAVSEMASSLKAISSKTQSAASYSQNIDVLASSGSQKSQTALSSLVAIKNLVTENQKLSQALDNYANKVKELASRMAALSDISKFLSLNVSIEAGKTSFTEEFSALVSQIRELNITSEQAAVSIHSLAADMQSQIEQAKQSSVYEWKETDKSIKVLGQTIEFLNKILGDVSTVSKAIKTIDKETGQSKEQADNINLLIKDLNKEAKSLVRHSDDVTRIIHQQLVVTRSLNRSSAALSKVTSTLDDLVGEKNE